MSTSLLGRGGSGNITANATLLYDRDGLSCTTADGGSCVGYTIRNDGDLNTQTGDLLLCVVDMNGELGTASSGIIPPPSNQTLANTSLYVPYHPGERAQVFRVNGKGIAQIWGKSSSGTLTISGGIFAQK